MWHIIYAFWHSISHSISHIRVYSVAFYLTSILTFYLASILTFYLTCFLASILTFSIWHLFWHSIWHTFYLAYILSGIYFDILSEMLSGIYSDILSEMTSDILSGIHSTWHTFYLASILTFYLTCFLASILTFYLTSILTFYLAYILSGIYSGVLSGRYSDVLSSMWSRDRVRVCACPGWAGAAMAQKTGMDRYAVIRRYGTKELHKWSHMNSISSWHMKPSIYFLLHPRICQDVPGFPRKPHLPTLQQPTDQGSEPTCNNRFRLVTRSSHMPWILLGTIVGGLFQISPFTLGLSWSNIHQSFKIMMNYYYYKLLCTYTSV